MGGRQVGQRHAVEQQVGTLAGEEGGSGQAYRAGLAEAAVAGSGAPEGDDDALTAAGRLSGPFWPQAASPPIAMQAKAQGSARQAGRLATLDSDFICGFYRP